MPISDIILPEWAAAVLIAAVLAMLGYIARLLVCIQITLAEYRVQLARIVSDIESEKGTRLRLHDTFDKRLGALEKRP